ncbi:hypothetical protein ACFQNF_06500 [Iodobacter arcticus]|uniref:LTD domain-containing protein n=1 Tax=Iodobacter arcticus TaxID=590593 RepID=A0ABW2QVS3_9NEIS
MNNDRLQQYGVGLAGLSLSLILSACGGGGGDAEPASVTPTAPPSVIVPTLTPTSVPASGPALPGALLISEVSSNYLDQTGAWLEIYNSSAQDLLLNGVSLRTAGSGWRGAPESFLLPANTWVKAGGYLLVAAKMAQKRQNTDQIVYVSDFQSTPYWDENGAVELVKDGVTLDFVRFGNSTAMPVSAGAWLGSNVGAMPVTYGQSLVRLGDMKVNSRSKHDWTLVPFATPGGLNDVAAAAVDRDLDGIPDSAEVPGGTFAGIDYYAMGARVGQPDIFIQIDHMKSNDLGITPAKEAMQKVVDAFKVRNIAVHFDSGALYSNEFSPAKFNLGGSRVSKHNEVAYHQCLGMSEKFNCASIYDYKDQSMDIRRKQVFHYLMMANSQKEDGTVGSSGYAELIGNDIIVTLGDWGLNTSSTNEINKLINFQAATIMHELGHNLGLDHGGNEGANNKPNYYSVMNYLYQLTGLGSSAQSASAIDRYFFAKQANGLGWNSLCKLDAGPCSRDFRIDYSDGSGSRLDENNLSESAMIGRGSFGAYADWNLDQQFNRSSYALDLNDDSNKAYLHDYNDWGNLTLAFARVASGNSGASMKRSASVAAINPILNDKQRWSVETAPSASFMAAVRRAH